MNRNTTIALALVLVLSVGLVAYGSQVGFVVIKNIDDPPAAGEPELTLTVLDTNGQTVDWQSADEIISGTIVFNVIVTSAGTQEIFYVALEVSTATGGFVGHWYFTVIIDQEEYNLNWDTTKLTDGAYTLSIKYALADPESAVDPPDGGDDGTGGGYDPKSGNVAFSMSLDTSESGTADIAQIAPKIDYVLPILALLLGGTIIVFLVLRFRR